MRLPPQNVLPGFLLYYLGMLADTIDFNNEALDYFFTPFKNDVNWEKILPRLGKIETSFLEEKAMSTNALSGIIDQNFINCFFYQFTAIDKKYSLRDFLDKDPRMALVKQMLTSTSIGLVLPSFKEEYGESKMIDLVGTISDEHLEGRMERKTGVELDEKGNLKVQMDVAA
mmetsp:Transcript_28082/g.27089  ORF Transcript_28082/g.27089 Transcript_28082/m.27089 type:complete len:171 (+) Transcript_28082:679-1191(+)